MDFLSKHEAFEIVLRDKIWYIFYDTLGRRNIRISYKENIKLANINVLGATNDFTVGVFKVDEKKYYSNEFKGNFEIVSLTGTINTMNNDFYTHIHMSAGNDKGEVFGGHLNRAKVSATCEMIINIIDGKVDRYFDEEIGLNIFKF